jgi:hypothetical protein
MNTKPRKPGAPPPPRRMSRPAAPPAVPDKVATQPAPAPAAAPPGQGNGKAVFSLRLAPALLDKARNACFWTPGLTLAALTDGALTREIARLETERGRPFPPRTANIPRGRRIV